MSERPNDIIERLKEQVKQQHIKEPAAVQAASDRQHQGADAGW